jgi:hypothetical protein
MRVRKVSSEMEGMSFYAMLVYCIIAFRPVVFYVSQNKLLKGQHSEGGHSRCQVNCQPLNLLLRVSSSYLEDHLKIKTLMTNMLGHSEVITDVPTFQTLVDGTVVYRCKRDKFSRCRETQTR